MSDKGLQQAVLDELELNVSVIHDHCFGNVRIDCAENGSRQIGSLA